MISVCHRKTDFVDCISKNQHKKKKKQKTNTTELPRKENQSHQQNIKNFKYQEISCVNKFTGLM